MNQVETALRNLLVQLPSPTCEEKDSDVIPTDFCYVRWLDIREAQAALEEVRKQPQKVFPSSPMDVYLARLLVDLHISVICVIWSDKDDCWVEKAVLVETLKNMPLSEAMDRLQAMREYNKSTSGRDRIIGRIVAVV